MFDVFAMLLSSITSFLFPIFASYKALKTSDPAQLTPWLMYWVVFSCCMLAESWVSFILVWIPFYGYIRLLFLLYLILPQSQGARIIYEERIHPFLEENEAAIDDFIATAHDRLKAAGLAGFRQAIEFVKTKLLGMPPTETPPRPPTPESAVPQSYTQSLLARFSVPAARWAGPANAGADLYNVLANAVSAASSGVAGSRDTSSSSRGLIPSDLQSSGEKMTFIAAQRERLSFLLTALDNEAAQLQRADAQDDDDEEPTQRPPSGLSGWSGLSKSRSEADFEKIEADSGAEDDVTIRRRRAAGSTGSSGWIPWGWGAAEGNNNNPASTTGADK